MASPPPDTYFQNVPEYSWLPNPPQRRRRRLNLTPSNHLNQILFRVPVVHSRSFIKDESTHLLPIHDNITYPSIRLIKYHRWVWWWRSKNISCFDFIPTYTSSNCGVVSSWLPTWIIVWNWSFIYLAYVKHIIGIWLKFSYHGNSRM
jgi:hypothetical protein